MRPDVQEVKVEQGLDQAMDDYRRFLEETPETAMTPEAMRRLADLQLEKQFGIRTGDAKPREMAAPQPAQALAGALADTTQSGRDASPALGRLESDQDFEQRTTAAAGSWLAADPAALPADAVRGDADPKGPLEAIALYDRLLTEYPNYEHRDKVLYQKARAYDELGRTEEAIETMERLIGANPDSEHFDEVQFRRGEYFFTRRRFRDAESAYSAIIGLGAASSYYELALYKLGWTFYKQDFYEEALHKYMALLDYKVSIGYDFDETHAEDDERRVADTFRVISLSFSNLGGPDAVREYYAAVRESLLRGPRLQQSRRALPRPSCATTTRRRPTRRSSRSIRSTVQRRASACAWWRPSPRAGSPSWCWRRSGSSRPSTDCRPSTGDTSSPKSHRRCWPT